VLKVKRVYNFSANERVFSFWIQQAAALEVDDKCTDENTLFLVHTLGKCVYSVTSYINEIK